MSTKILLIFTVFGLGFSVSKLETVFGIKNKSSETVIAKIKELPTTYTIVTLVLLFFDIFFYFR